MHIRYYLMLALFFLCALVRSTPLSPTLNPIPPAEPPVLAGTLPPPVFEPTDEWQPVLEGQSIPAGLHVRMDVYNGGRWAKKLAPEGSEGASASAAAASGSAVVAVVDGQGEVLTDAHPPSPIKGEKKEEVEEDPAITAAVQGLSASEAAKARILLGLPEPEPLLSAAASSQLPPEELEALLAKVWAKRQEQVKEAWDSFKTEGQQMKGVLDSLELGANSQPITHGEFLEKLEDLEYHVSNVHNAEDFAAMGGLAAMAKYLNSSEEGVPARAAWVIGSAVKGQPNLVDIAIADGVTISLAVFFRNTLGASEACATPCDPTPHLRTLAKGVYAVGGLTRFHGGAQKDFFALGGVSFLTRALKVSLAAVGGGEGAGVAANPAAAASAGRAVLEKTLHLLADLALPEEVYEDPHSTPDVTTSNLLRFRLDALNATPAAATPAQASPTLPPPVPEKEGGGGAPPKIVRLSGEGAVDEGGVKPHHATPATSTPSAWVLALIGEPVGKRGLCQGVAQTLVVLGEGVLEADEGVRVKAFCA